jgi:glycosyltransferase involved in cell wall biosynthesis
MIRNYSLKRDQETLLIMKNKKMSVTIVQRQVPHYRLPFFKCLSAINPDMEIIVCHGDKNFSDNDSVGFHSRYYESYTIKLMGFTLVLQPKLVISVLLTRPDIVVVEGTFGVITNGILLFCRRIMALPTLYWTAGWDNPSIKGLRAKFKNFVISLFLKLCDGAIVYGSSAVDYMIAHGLSRSKILVAQNTINVEAIIEDQFSWKMRGMEIRKKLVIDTKNIIVYVGHMAPIKRVDVLLKAFFILRQQKEDLALLIVGKGEQLDRLKNNIDTQHIPDVYFAGEVVEGVEAYFAAGDVFVMPGTGGLALNQAMALGLPVIASIADGTQKDLIIQGENGFIVPVDDEKALAGAINKVLSSRENRIMMGRRSLEIICRRATLQNMAEKYSKAIRLQFS